MPGSLSLQVAEDVGLRKEQGIAKYGTCLQPGNGRDAVQDAYEEALDLCQYLRQGLEEGQALQLYYIDALHLCINLRFLRDSR